MSFSWHGTLPTNRPTLLATANATLTIGHAMRPCAVCGRLTMACSVDASAFLCYAHLDAFEYMADNTPHNFPTIVRILKGVSNDGS